MGKTSADDPCKKFKKSIDPDRPVTTISKRPKANKANQPKSHKSRRPASPLVADAQQDDHNESIATATPAPLSLRDVEMPAAGSTITASDLSANQKNVVKRNCQRMFGHKHTPTEERKPRVNLETATSQLAEMMQLAKKRKADAAALKKTDK